MKPLVFLFFVRGVVVSIFAILGDLLKPKSFAGLFGAAPSVALATIGLTILSESPSLRDSLSAGFKFSLRGPE
jgi:hypothetical protein